MNANDFTLADRYALAKDALDAAEKLVKELRKEILATGAEMIHGEMASVVVSLSERNSLDANMAKSFLTADQITQCTKTSLVETLRIKPTLTSKKVA